MPNRSPPPEGTVLAPELGAPAVAPPQRIPSDQLLGGGNELVIEHRGREYRLRVTQNGKLILTA